MASVNLALKLFSQQIAYFTPNELMRAINSNYSVAQGLKKEKAAELATWRGMLVPLKIIQPDVVQQFLQGITPMSVVQTINRTRPDLALIIQNNPRGQAWLEIQINEVRALISG